MFKKSSIGYLTRFKKKFSNVRENPDIKIRNILDKYGKLIIEILKAKTPVDSGFMASGWTYEVTEEGHKSSLKIYNSEETDKGLPVVLLLMYGYRSESGEFVKGNNYVIKETRGIVSEMVTELEKIREVQDD